MEHEDIVLDSIWLEMSQANTNVFYAELLIDRHLKRNKYFNVFIACFSIGGAGLSLIDLVFPAAICIIIGVAEVIKCLIPCWIMKPDDIAKLSLLSIKYDNYFYALKKTFDNLLCNRLSSEKAEKEYYKAIESNISNKKEMSELFGEIDEKLNVISARKNETFLNKIYHGKETSNCTITE